MDGFPDLGSELEYICLASGKTIWQSLVPDRIADVICSENERGVLGKGNG